MTIDFWCWELSKVGRSKGWLDRVVAIGFRTLSDDYRLLVLGGVEGREVEGLV
jgi:hypothetical protein